MKYFKRFLGLPFFIMLNIIGMIWHLFVLSKYWMLYGGEAVVYSKKNQRKSIADIFYLIEEQYIKTNKN